MRYRIMLAVNGSYYVQRPNCYGDYKKFGGFFNTKAEARTFVNDVRTTCCDKIVEYVN